MVEKPRQTAAETSAWASGGRRVRKLGGEDCNNKNSRTRSSSRSRSSRRRNSSSSSNAVTPTRTWKEHDGVRVQRIARAVLTNQGWHLLVGSSGLGVNHKANILPAMKASKRNFETLHLSRDCIICSGQWNFSYELFIFNPLNWLQILLNLGSVALGSLGKVT